MLRLLVDADRRQERDGGGSSLVPELLADEQSGLAEPVDTDGRQGEPAALHGADLR